jgi:hypothetical protein
MSGKRWAIIAMFEEPPQILETFSDEESAKSAAAGYALGTCMIKQVRIYPGGAHSF